MITVEISGSGCYFFIHFNVNPNPPDAFFHNVYFIQTKRLSLTLLSIGSFMIVTIKEII